MTSQRGEFSPAPSERPDLSELSRRLDQVASSLSGWIRRNEPQGGGAAVPPNWFEVDALAAARSVRQLIRQRRARSRYFPPDLFADPAWDILLDLTAARLENAPVPISSLCIAAGVPTTTALRWISTLLELGLLARRSDPADRRRVFVELTQEGWEAMSRYFASHGGGIDGFEVGRLA